MIIRPEAEADLAQARDWYEAQRAGLGDKLLEHVGDVLARIDRAPETAAPGYKGMRPARVHRFPFAVVYRIETQGVVVHAVLHTSRDPQHWKSRA